MPNAVLIIRSLHMLSAIAMVGGIFARQIVRREAALAIAFRERHMTPELESVVGERAGWFWHLYEEAAVLVIVLLMALKPS